MNWFTLDELIHLYNKSSRNDVQNLNVIQVFFKSQMSNMTFNMYVRATYHIIAINFSSKHCFVQLGQCEQRIKCNELIQGRSHLRL